MILSIWIFYEEKGVHSIFHLEVFSEEYFGIVQQAYIIPGFQDVINI